MHRPGFGSTCTECGRYIGDIGEVCPGSRLETNRLLGRIAEALERWGPRVSLPSQCPADWNYAEVQKWLKGDIQYRPSGQCPVTGCKISGGHWH
jgi:hypothetical protein